MPLIPNYDHIGGIHPETAAFANILRAKGITAPHTDQPYSEAMILGLSGGLGAGYILWEFKEHRDQHNIKVLVLAFKNSWQYPARHFQALGDRLGLPISMPETGSKNAALKSLTEALAANNPVIAWVDGASMPYFQLPPNMMGHTGHFVGICGTDGDAYLIDDLAPRPFRVEADVLEAARGRIGSFKNRLVIVEGRTAGVPLNEAIMQGLEDCITHLSGDSESFSLPTIRKWARLITDGKNAKGWQKLFADRRGLFSTLISLFEAIALNGAPGGLRGLYADFLREASPIVSKPALLEAAAQYDALADQWDALAEEALPDAVPLFADTKRLLRERDAVLKQGGDAWRTTEGLTQQLRAHRSEGNLNLPLSDGEVGVLFAALQSRLNSIYGAEVAALGVLKDAAGITGQ
jgi:hypothetical protein